MLFPDLALHINWKKGGEIISSSKIIRSLIKSEVHTSCRAAFLKKGGQDREPRLYPLPFYLLTGEVTIEKEPLPQASGGYV